MRRFIQLVLTGFVLCGLLIMTSAFSLLGPYEDWQTEGIGYNPLNTDLGGVMNIGEEYRWNVGTIVYGFDSSFLDYFGPRGRVEVNKATAVYNALPAVSQMSSDLSEFPLDTRRSNFRAAALTLLDMKSLTMAILSQQVGLAAAERYVWTLRAETDIGGGETRYTVIRRNFEPTRNSLFPPPTSYVNGVLYTFAILFFTDPDFVDAVEVPVDPLAFTFRSVSAAGGDFYGESLNFGEFFTGMTRDDVGGLRFLYRPNNFNTEALIDTNVTLTSSSPWTPIGGTNGAGGTNVVTAVSQAIRPGLDKLTFQEGAYDSLLGAFITVTNQVTDRFVTNSAIVTQIYQRIITQPDILFTAEDLGLNDGGIPVSILTTGTDGWINNAAIHGQAALAGPGTITPQIVVSFNKVGPFVIIDTPTTLNEANATLGFVWGSFDGTTNAPIVYPDGSSAADLERQILGEF